MTDDNIEDRLDEWRERNPLYAFRRTKDTFISIAATILDVSINSLSSWERGLSMPSDENFVKIAAFMDRKEKSLRKTWSRWLKDKPTVNRNAV